MSSLINQSKVLSVLKEYTDEITIRQAYLPDSNILYSPFNQENEPKALNHVREIIVPVHRVNLFEAIKKIESFDGSIRFSVKDQNYHLYIYPIKRIASTSLPCKAISRRFTVKNKALELKNGVKWKCINRLADPCTEGYLYDFQLVNPNSVNFPAVEPDWLTVFHNLTPNCDCLENFTTSITIPITIAFIDNSLRLSDVPYSFLDHVMEKKIFESLIQETQRYESFRSVTKIDHLKNIKNLITKIEVYLKLSYRLLNSYNKYIQNHKDWTRLLKNLGFQIIDLDNQIIRVPDYKVLCSRLKIWKGNIGFNIARVNGKVSHMEFIVLLSTHSVVWSENREFIHDLFIHVLPMLKNRTFPYRNHHQIKVAEHVSSIASQCLAIIKKTPEDQKNIFTLVFSAYLDVLSSFPLYRYEPSFQLAKVTRIFHGHRSWEAYFQRQIPGFKLKWLDSLA